jgi:hypothetical protein
VSCIKLVGGEVNFKKESEMDQPIEKESRSDGVVEVEAQSSREKPFICIGGW